MMTGTRPLRHALLSSGGEMRAEEAVSSTKLEDRFGQAEFQDSEPRRGRLAGAFSAAVLASLEKQTGKRIVEHFDLITGTSTGGLIAIGLAMGGAGGEASRFLPQRRGEDLPQDGASGGLGADVSQHLRGEI